MIEAGHRNIILQHSSSSSFAEIIDSSAIDNRKIRRRGLR